jgi:hypothetical protein
MDLEPNCKMVLWSQDSQGAFALRPSSHPDDVTTKPEARDLPMSIVIFPAYAGPRHEGARE